MLETPKNVVPGQRRTHVCIGSSCPWDWSPLIYSPLKVVAGIMDTCIARCHGQCLFLSATIAVLLEHISLLKTRQAGEHALSLLGGRVGPWARYVP